jgi:hypothetical protein
MTYHWRYSTGAQSVTFPTQADAETWVGEVWQDLLADGVEDVTLLEEQRVVYGPMSLRPGT